MVEDAWLQWALALVFVLTALHSVGRAAASRSVGSGIGHGLHVVMSLDMVAMCWPWWTVIPAWPQGVLFGAAAAWFASRLGLHWRRGQATARFALHQASHAVMMLVMVWMVAAMGPMVSAGSGRLRGASGATAASAGSTGSGADMAAAMAGAHSHGMLGPVAGLIGSLLVALLIAAGVIFALDAARRATGRLHAVANSAMCAGMVVMCWPMIAS